MAAETSIYDFEVKSITGEAIPLSQYQGKVLLIVNTASKCGFTKQYDDLVELQSKMNSDEFTVLAFPANNFGNQEPGSADEIQTFCETRFNINFPLMDKVSVKGHDQHPLFAYLTTAENQDFTGPIKWNFEKFIIDGDGQLQRRFRSMTNPSGKKMAKAISAYLEENN